VKQGFVHLKNYDYLCCRNYQFLDLFIMARPIADTPVLRGKDAVRFMERMENVKPISKEERAKMKADYEWVKSIAKFPL
jgi:hypothetical protein